ncbi:MAG: hypothetical protein Q4F28_02975 [Eubacteriales bacterium]|nr:hypothetical protein [Eubacteriales bacterium]
MCHRYRRNPDTDRYGDGDVPEADMEPYQSSESANTTTPSSNSGPQKSRDYYKDVEPLPESSRPRRDGPGGN